MKNNLMRAHPEKGVVHNLLPLFSTTFIVVPVESSVSSELEKKIRKTNSKNKKKQ
jgi:hypothetical protein